MPKMGCKCLFFKQDSLQGNRELVLLKQQMLFLVSGSKENIPVGATVYGHSYRYNAKCGNHDAGHVGIYVGNGNVVSRENTVKLRTLQEWINVYGWKGWGWNGSQDFSKIN